MASEQAQVAGLFLSLSFRLQIGQFDAGMEGIPPCSVALKGHFETSPRKLAQVPNSIAARWCDLARSHQLYGIPPRAPRGSRGSTESRQNIHPVQRGVRVAPEPGPAGTPVRPKRPRRQAPREGAVRREI